MIEGEEGHELFFVVSGGVSVIDKGTKTHIHDLKADDYFGEISFFSEIPRQATVKACDFTEVLVLKRDDFLQMAIKVSEQAIEMYYHIQSMAYDRNFRILLV